MFTKTNLLFYRFFIFVFLFELRAGSDDLHNRREGYTGRLAAAEQFPFAIRLYSQMTDYTVTYCTATIITFSKLLTAGHCCQTKAFRFVVSGNPDQTGFVSGQNRSDYDMYRVKKVIIHPDFEHTNIKLVHDLCLLILEESLSQKNGHQTIQISYEEMKNKKSCTALGWGSNFGYEIQHRLYYKLAVGYGCNLRFGNSSRYWFICLEPHSVCPGDSGGPLVCDGKLYGIASFFISRGNRSYPRCEEGAVDFYCDVTREKRFIEENGFRRTLRPSYAAYLLTVLSSIQFLFCPSTEIFN